jgi:adenosyl cobinamide kinase/adenosyl cobinamide phosphate guanylyltransferase
VRELILGGVRSGKSRLAESRARQSLCEVVYLATASAGDDAGLQQRGSADSDCRPDFRRTVVYSLDPAISAPVRSAVSFFQVTAGSSLP